METIHQAKVLKAESLVRLSEGRSPIRINLIVEQAKTIDFTGVFRPERAARLSVGRSPTLTLDKILSPERAARMMRTPLQGLILTHFFEGLRPSLKRDALSGLDVFNLANS